MAVGHHRDARHQQSGRARACAGAGVAGHPPRPRRATADDDAGARTPAGWAWACAVVLIGVIIVRFDPSPEHRLVSIVSPPPNGITWLVNLVPSPVLRVLAALVVLAFSSGRRALARDVAGRPAWPRSGHLSRPVGDLSVRTADRPTTRHHGVNLDYPLPTDRRVAVATAAVPGLSRSGAAPGRAAHRGSPRWPPCLGVGSAGERLASLALGCRRSPPRVHLVFGSPLGLPSGPEVSVSCWPTWGSGPAEVVPSIARSGGGPLTGVRIRRAGRSPSPSTAGTPRRPAAGQDRPPAPLPGLGPTRP